MKTLDDFYLKYEEPTRSCLLALRTIILAEDRNVTPAFKYGMPFFCYHGKMFCYLWVHKKHKQPYLGLVEGKQIDHPELLIEKRSKMKIMLFNPYEDLPLKTVKDLLKQAVHLCKMANKHTQ